MVVCLSIIIRIVLTSPTPWKDLQDTQGPDTSLWGPLATLNHLLAGLSGMSRSCSRVCPVLLFLSPLPTGTPSCPRAGLLTTTCLAVDLGHASFSASWGWCLSSTSQHMPSTPRMCCLLEGVNTLTVPYRCKAFHCLYEAFPGMMTFIPHFNSIEAHSMWAFFFFYTRILSLKALVLTKLYLRITWGAFNKCTNAWRIPWTEEHGGLWSIGSERVRHNWSD